MVRVGKILSGDFLRGSELKGKELVVDVVTGGDFMPTQYKDQRGRTKEQLVVPVRFKGSIRKLGINKTSVRRIALEYSEDTEKWVGRRLTLKPETRIIAEKETIVIWAYPIPEDSLKKDLLAFTDEEKKRKKK